MRFEPMTHEEEPVCGAWQRFVQALLILFLAITALVLLPCLFPKWFPRNSSRLEDQVRTLTAQVRLLEQEQEMPSLVLDRYRNSICYIFGTIGVIWCCGSLGPRLLRIDLRTVFPRQDGDLGAALRAACSPSASSG